MKRLASLLLVLLSAACPAQQAPVNIAVELYKGCMIGFTQAEVELPRTAQGVQSLAKELDEKCLNWTLIWLPSMVNKDRGGLTAAEYLRFDQHRRSLLNSYIKEIIEAR